MRSDVFTVIVEPRRRQILDHQRVGPASVNELVDVLGMPQPAVSKHLKVLRDGGLVASRVAAQQRIYSLNHRPLEAVDAFGAAGCFGGSERMPPQGSFEVLASGIFFSVSL